MKILFVNHSFLPYSSTGVENYTYTLAKYLSHKDEVLIYSAIFDPSKERFKKHRYQYDGLDIISFYHDSVYRDFSETYLSRRQDELFEEIIKEFSPDVVHFQHIMFHSVGYIDILNRKDIPSILTLHDFYYLCPDLGQRLFLGRYRCKNKFPLKCALCFKISKINISEIDKRLYNQGRRIPLVQKIAKDLPELSYLIKGMRILRRIPTANDIIVREQAMLSFLGGMKIIISPSAYYKEIYERYTNHPAIVHLDYGFEIDGPLPDKKGDGGVQTIGFIGTISRHKGAHLLLELANRFKGSIKIVVWGNDKNDIMLSKRIKDNKFIEYRGQFEPKNKRDIFNEIDYLLVPSIWEENSPLVIHEALIYNTPVIASNIGGNAELIIEGKNGFTFDPYNLYSLFRLIEKIQNNNIRIKEVDNSVVMDISEHAKRLYKIYKSLLS
ncbi:MAG: glycosyltransferase [Myxococcota bacterium]